MGDIVNLIPDRQKLIEDRELLVDLARFAEGIVDESAIKKKYRLKQEVWDALGTDDEFVGLVLDEKTRRIRNGQHKREKSQLLIVKAPAILDSIMSDVSASPRHRVDAIKTLDSFTGNPQEGAPLADRFQIVINLGADVDGKPIIETYDKARVIDPNDGDPNGGFVTPQGAVAAIADKPWDDSDVAATPEQKKPVKASAPMRTGYKSIDHVTIKDSRTPYEIALAALMERG